MVDCKIKRKESCHSLSWRAMAFERPRSLELRSHFGLRSYVATSAAESGPCRRESRSGGRCPRSLLRHGHGIRLLPSEAIAFPSWPNLASIPSNLARLGTDAQHGAFHSRAGPRSSVSGPGLAPDPASLPCTSLWTVPLRPRWYPPGWDARCLPSGPF